MVFPLLIAKGVASGISWLMGRRYKKKTKSSLESLQMQLKLIAGSMAGIPPQAMENIKTDEDLIEVLEKVGIHNKENPREVIQADTSFLKEELHTFKQEINDVLAGVFEKISYTSAKESDVDEAVNYLDQNGIMNAELRVRLNSILDEVKAQHEARKHEHDEILTEIRDLRGELVGAHRPSAILSLNEDELAKKLPLVTLDGTFGVGGNQVAAVLGENFSSTLVPGRYDYATICHVLEKAKAKINPNVLDVVLISKDIFEIKWGGCWNTVDNEKVGGNGEIRVVVSNVPKFLSLMGTNTLDIPYIKKKVMLIIKNVLAEQFKGMTYSAIEADENDLKKLLTRSIMMRLDTVGLGMASFVARWANVC